MNEAKHAIESKVEKAVVEAVNRSPDASYAAAKPISDAVAKEVVPLALHATNNENWWESRVTLGAIFSTLVTILTSFGIGMDWFDVDQAVAIVLALGVVAGNLFTLYGRWKARKPIGQ